MIPNFLKHLLSYRILKHRKVMAFLGVLFVNVFFIPGAHATGDEVEELITEGKLAYQKGSLPEASEKLQQALGLIAELSLQSFMDMLPNAPKGWIVENGSADESALFSGIGGLVVATKLYKEKPASSASLQNIPPPKTMKIALVSNLPSFAQMAVNAMVKLRGVKPDSTVLVISGFQGSVSCDKKERCEVMLPIDEKTLITAESQHASKEELLALLRKIKLDQFSR